MIKLLSDPTASANFKKKKTKKNAEETSVTRAEASYTFHVHEEIRIHAVLSKKG